MTSPFENLAGPGKALRAEPPDTAEFAGLQRMGLARLHASPTRRVAPAAFCSLRTTTSPTTTKA